MTTRTSLTEPSIRPKYRDQPSASGPRSDSDGHSAAHTLMGGGGGDRTPPAADPKVAHARPGEAFSPAPLPLCTRFVAPADRHARTGPVPRPPPPPAGGGGAADRQRPFSLGGASAAATPAP